MAGLRDNIKISNPTEETRTAFGVTVETEEVETRCLLKNVSATGAALYQTRGYEAVEKEVVIRCQGSFPTDTVSFAGTVEVEDSRTGDKKKYDIITPAVRRGNFIVFGVRSAGS